ncbi:MAG: hypothetical protein Fur0043_00160 [Anaerolineales bacterium]
MEFLLDPNVAYLCLLVGIFLGLLAMVMPGTGMLEVGAFFGLALAGYAVYNHSINLWALLILLLSVFPFMLAIRKPKRESFLVLSLLGLVVGSIFLFATEGWRPAVNPLLALISSGLFVGFVWLAVRKALQAAQTRPAHDLTFLEGQIGEAKTPIHHEGSVQVAGELWSARSDKPIRAGSVVRVVGRSGLILEVQEENGK